MSVLTGKINGAVMKCGHEPVPAPLLGKDAAMMKDNHRAAHALFRSVGDGGAELLFVILSDGWAITCDEEQIAAGTSDRASIDAGVAQFVSLAVHVAGAATCDPVVLRQLDRIEAASPVRGATRNRRPREDRTRPEVAAPFSLVKRRPNNNIKPRQEVSQ